MIERNNLTDADVGRKVIYTPFELCSKILKEEGHITSWNGSFIFVDYGHSCGRGIATDPDDLDFLMEV